MHSHLSDDELFNGNYQIYRKERYTDSINKEEGVLRAIKSLISSKFIELEDNSIEEICVCLQKTSDNIYIFNSYIPPQNSLVVYKAHMDNISYITCGRSLTDSNNISIYYQNVGGLASFSLLLVKKSIPL